MCQGCVHLDTTSITTSVTIYYVCILLLIQDISHFKKDDAQCTQGQIHKELRLLL